MIARRLPAVLLLALIAACGNEPAATPAAPSPRFTESGWYRDVVFYQIWVRSYADSDGDGIGDLRGLRDRLDYIAALGVGGLWLSPFYPTPYVDSGYDVADYVDVDPAYGTLADYDTLVAEAHARGIRVFNDLVLNHTSSEHPWFIESRSSRDNPRRDWYVWADVPLYACPNADAQAFGTERWTLDATTGQRYYHQFYPQQPDLNYWNPAVRDTMLDQVRFWLDRGTDGFRVDAISTLFEEPASTAPGGKEICSGHPMTHAYLKRLRGVLDGYHQRAMLAEAFDTSYFGNGADEFHMSMSGPITVGLRTGLGLNQPSLTLGAYLSVLAKAPPGAQVAPWLSNHDFGRIMPSVGGDARRAALGAVLLLTLPGTPIVYYGDEVGMGHGTDVVVDYRDRARTPMAWAAGPGAGFTTGTPWLAAAPDSGGANVAAQEGAPGSLLTLYRRLIAFRNRVGILGTASLALVASPAPATGALAGFLREQGDRRVLVLVNAQESAVDMAWDLSAVVTRPASCPVANFAPPPLAPDTAAAWRPTLPAFGYVICEW